MTLELLIHSIVSQTTILIAQLATSGAASEEELEALRKLPGADGLDELIWALIYRLGPLSLEQFNAGHALPESYTRVVVYAGQCLIDEGSAGEGDPT